MTPYSTFIIYCWLAFLLVWFFMSFGMKRNVRSRRLWVLRIGFALVVILLVRVSVFFGVNPATFIWLNPGTSFLGAVCVALGVTLAIWARVYLGSNWGMPMSEKENPELVTRGPYKLLRHPIYSGVLLAVFGSVIEYGLVWVLVFIGALAYFIYSARTEEGIMEKTFPNTYPAYKKRTYMLIPFIY